MGTSVHVRTEKEKKDYLKKDDTEKKIPYIYVRVNIYVLINKSIYVHTCMKMYVCIYVCTHVYVYIDVYIYTYICIDIDVHLFSKRDRDRTYHKGLFPQKKPVEFQRPPPFS